jgi:hypothetical protein
MGEHLMTAKRMADIIRLFRPFVLGDLSPLLATERAGPCAILNRRHQ